jgi:diacylglycerol kinase family enzyme
MSGSGTARRRPWIILANRDSTGRGGGLRAVSDVLRRARIRFHAHVPPTAEAGRALGREYANRDVVFAVLGGDGTVNNAASQMLGGRAWFAALPGGMENLMSRESGLPADPALAAEALLDARPRPWDAGFLGGRPFLMIAGVGFDGVVCAETAGLAKSMFKQAAYAVTIVRLLLTPTPVFSVKWDGKKCPRCVQVSFCNGALYGGGFMVNPKADPSDGVLDMAVFPFMGHLQRGYQITTAFLSKREHTPHFSRHRIYSAFVASRRTLPAQVDGEPFRVRNPEVTVRKGALKVLVVKPR